MSQPEGPGTSRVERKKEETKRKIIEVALNLFKQQGFEATTMEQIASVVDIAKGTLYNYFPVKEAILNEFIQRAFQARNSERILQLRELPDTRSRMILILHELIAGIQSQKEIFEKYFVYRIQNMLALSREESMESGFGLLGVEIIKLGQKNGEIRSDLPFEILKALFEFVFIVVAQQFYKDPEHFQARQLIEQGADLFMNGAKSIHYRSEENL